MNHENKRFKDDEKDKFHVAFRQFSDFIHSQVYVVSSFIATNYFRLIIKDN